ncbi:MAG: hypothetical protein FWD28_04185 [Treponema sp.]|nr:hypothetical protein [Treponema sp.]
MEKIVFSSPKKHRIIAVRDLLYKNNIPVTSIKLYFYLELKRGSLHRDRNDIVTEIIEKRDELNIPIENFYEKLNDSQTLEIYVNENNEESALKLIETINIETLFNDCIFKSTNYDETFEKYLLLTRNIIQCDDVYEYNDEFLLFIDPENKQEALNLLEPNNKKGNIYQYKEVHNNHSKVYETNEKNPIRFILPILIILFILFFRINNQFIIEIIINFLTGK